MKNEFTITITKEEAIEFLSFLMACSVVEINIPQHLLSLFKKVTIESEKNE